MKFSLSGDVKSTTLEVRFYNTIVLFGVLNSIIVIIFNSFFPYPPFLNIFILFSGLIFFVLYYFGRLRKKPIINNLWLVSSVSFMLIGAWIYNDGYWGSTPFYIFIATVFILFLLSKKASIYFIVFLILMVTVLCYIQYNYPQYIYPYQSQEQKLFDILFAFITLIFTLGYAVFAFKRNFYAERELNIQHKKQIELQYEELEKLHNILKETNEELRLQHNEIALKNEELQDLNTSKNKFFGIIAHDLKNPFNSIFGFSDLLINDIETLDREHILCFVKTIRNSSQNTYELLENLLIWSQSQTGTIGFKRIQFDLKKLILEVVKLTSSNCLVKNIKTTVDVADNILINADRNMISTVIRNLVSNAIKYTLRGGEIAIKVEQTNKLLHISVIDNGIGICEADKAKLFAICEKTSLPGTENETGTGLGLILCKEFVERHNGKITVESTFGKGSSFIVTLPLLM